MNRENLQRGFRKASFTLVELLVAIAVLSIMLVALAGITGVVSNAWINGIGTVDNFTKARVTLSLMDRDIQMMVLRRDLAAFSDQTNGSVCAFYTQVQGQPGIDTRTLSLVQYSLAQPPTPTTATNSILRRFSYGMNYSTAASAMTPTVGYSASLVQMTNSVVAAAAPDEVSSGVVAFEWQFIDGTGTIQTPSSTTPFLYNFSNPSSTSNYRAVIVSMVVLSSSAYQTAIQTGKLGTLIGVFSTTAPANQTYSQVWNAFLAAPNATFLGLPSPMRAGVKVFERLIPLPITTPSS